MAQLTLSERSLTKHMTLNVTVRVRRSWRVRAGLWLVRWGSRLAGLGYCETTDAHDD